MAIHSIITRHQKKWTISEVLKLQREYELLELSIYEIATRHKRSVKAILFKLQSEGLIDNWNEARGYILQTNLDNTIADDILTPSLSDTSEDEYTDESNLTTLNNVDKLELLIKRFDALENTVNNLNLHMAKLFAQTAQNQINSVQV